MCDEIVFSKMQICGHAYVMSGYMHLLSVDMMDKVPICRRLVGIGLRVYG